MSRTRPPAPPPDALGLRKAIEHTYADVPQRLAAADPTADAAGEEGEEFDAQAAAEAQRMGMPRSEPIWGGLAAVLPIDEPEPSGNLWLDLAGFGEAGVSVKPSEIDEVVYGL